MDYVILQSHAALSLPESSPEALLSKYGFEAAADQVPRNYLLKKNGWKINIITDRVQEPEAVTLEHSLAPD